MRLRVLTPCVFQRRRAIEVQVRPFPERVGVEVTVSVAVTSIHARMS